MASIELELFSDIACPFCFIGERTLKTALATRPTGRFLLRWRAFQLQPELPPEGVAAAPFYSAKFGGAERMQALFAQTAEHGRRANVELRFDRMARAPNTRLAHRIIQLAARSGLADAVAEALFVGHFQEGSDVSDLEEVLALLTRHGIPLDTNALRIALSRGEGDVEVDEDLRLGRALGVSGVPLVLGPGRLALIGAQPPAQFERFLDVLEERADTER